MGAPPVDDKPSDTLVVVSGEGFWTGSSTLPHLHQCSSRVPSGEHGLGEHPEAVADPLERGNDVWIERADCRQNQDQELAPSREDRRSHRPAVIRHRDARDPSVAIVLGRRNEPASRQAPDHPADRRDLGADPGRDLGHRGAAGVLTHDHQDAPLGKCELEGGGDERAGRDRHRPERHGLERGAGAVPRLVCPRHAANDTGSRNTLTGRAVLVSMWKPKSHRGAPVGGW